MEYRRLGRTGLQVSVLSLGTGGPNQFGQLRYASREDICALVRHALDLGINYFDTASGYSESEERLGQALRGVPRDRYHLSSKINPLQGGSILDPAEARRRLERSLRRLGVEALDVLYLHKVRPAHYRETVERLMPLLRDLQAEGKVGFLGISESSKHDAGHRMLGRALQENHFDAVMVARHPGDRQCEEQVLPQAQASEVGVVGMTAARYLVVRSPAERLKLLIAAVHALAASPPEPGRVTIRLRNALSAIRRSGPRQTFTLTRPGDLDDLALPELGYTFALSHPVVATVLTGTTDRDHLERNVRSALAPALQPDETRVLRDWLEGPANS